jgi:hypothetical protein
MVFRSVDVEKLIGDDHSARLIWELVGRLDLGGKRIGTGTPAFQALTIFHGLGHAGGMLAGDSRSSTQSQTNSDIIAEKCKKAISSVGSQ